MRANPLSALLAAAVTATAALACSDATALPPAQYENVVDTATLAALTGTPIGAPSAFDGVQGIPARTDLNAPFDFAVDFDGTGALEVLPAGALGYFADPGVLVVDRTFDAVASAPTEGYVADSAVVMDVGTVFVLRSRISSQQCAVSGSLPRYAKLHILEIDAQARTVTFEFLANLNCGYRGLEPGTPSN